MRRTTIFISDELHEQLRHEAFRAKTGMAEIIRARLQGSIDQPRKRMASKDPILKLAGICNSAGLSSKIDESLYGG